MRLAFCFLILCCLAAAAEGQENGADRAVRVDWRTGADLLKQLRLTASVQSSEIELRERLIRLSQVHRVAIFLDRRIDPNQLVEFSVSDVSLAELLARLAQQVDAATARIGSVIYVGPPRSAGVLPAVAAQRRKDLARLRTSARTGSWSWEELAEPRQLLTDLTQQSSMSVANPEQLPHDLWPAADLPPLDLADRLSLLLVGFDLTFEVAGQGQLRLAPMPRDLVYEREYFPADAAAALAMLKQDFPRLAARREGSRVIVRGVYDDHERIAPLLKGESKPAAKSNPDDTRYTLTVEGKAAGAVVAEVARRLGKKLQYDPALREKLSQPVSLKVKDVSLDELLRQTLDGLGLTYRISDEALEVIAKP